MESRVKVETKKGTSEVKVKFVPSLVLSRHLSSQTLELDSPDRTKFKKTLPQAGRQACPRERERKSEICGEEVISMYRHNKRENVVRLYLWTL